MHGIIKDLARRRRSVHLCGVLFNSEWEQKSMNSAIFLIPPLVTYHMACSSNNSIIFLAGIHEIGFLNYCGQRWDDATLNSHFKKCFLNGVKTKCWKFKFNLNLIPKKCLFKDFITQIIIINLATSCCCDKNHELELCNQDSFNYHSIRSNKLS